MYNNNNNNNIISTDEDPGLRIESFAVIHLRGVSTNKNYKNYIVEWNFQAVSHSRTQSPSYARRDEGLWPNP